MDTFRIENDGEGDLYDDDQIKSDENSSDDSTVADQMVVVRKYFPETFVWEFVSVDGLVFNVVALHPF